MSLLTCLDVLVLHSLHVLAPVESMVSIMLQNCISRGSNFSVTSWWWGATTEGGFDLHSLFVGLLGVSDQLLCETRYWVRLGTFLRILATLCAVKKLLVLYSVPDSQMSPELQGQNGKEAFVPGL